MRERAIKQQKNNLISVLCTHIVRAPAKRAGRRRDIFVINSQAHKKVGFIQWVSRSGTAANAGSSEENQAEPPSTPPPGYRSHNAFEPCPFRFIRECTFDITTPANLSWGVNLWIASVPGPNLPLAVLGGPRAAGTTASGASGASCWSGGEGDLSLGHSESEGEGVLTTAIFLAPAPTSELPFTAADGGDDVEGDAAAAAR